jgi:sugar lactone lactonase YvrE
MNNYKKVSLVFASLFVFALFGCQKEEPTSTPTQAPAPKTATAPESITFTKAALYPEGVEYDAKRNAFLVTSLHEGLIGEVSDDGIYKVFAQDPNFVSAIGIRIDAERDRLLVCNSDPGASIHTKQENQGKLAGLGIFQLSTGKLIKYLDLGKLGGAGGHFCNDIALDSAGNAYVTDSFSPIIYKVDSANNATVLLNNERFTGEGFNLNGIVVKDNYLLVTKYNDGLLFKVPIDQPEQFTQVEMKETLVGADGLLWAPDGSLVVIANLKTNKVFKLDSSDNWASANVISSVDTGDVFPTTGVVRDGKIYALYAMLHVLFNPETKTHVEKFEIRQQNLQTVGK